MTYHEPPEHICDKEDVDIDIDPDEPGRLVIHINLWTYRGRTVRFANSLTTHTAMGWATMTRIDTCHGQVHRHVFDNEGNEVDNKTYATIEEDPAQSRQTVEHWSDRSYDMLVDQAEDEWRRWSAC